MTGIKQHDTVSWALHPDQSDSKDIMLHLAPKQPLCDKCEKMLEGEEEKAALGPKDPFAPAAKKGA